MNATTASRTDASVSVVSLFAQSDEAFVRAAYLAILGREVDPDGLTNYVGQVRTGTPKEQIVAELARSSEGQQRTADLAGLTELLARPARPMRSIWARLFARLTAAAMEPLLKQLRIIDNTAARIDVSLQQQLKQLAEVVYLLEQNSQVSAGPSVRSDGEPVERRRTVQVLHLSPSRGRLFSDLKAAVAFKRRH